MSTTVNLQGVAGTAEKVIETLMKVEPVAETIAAAVVPGAAPIVAVVHPVIAIVAPFLEQALTSISAGNNGDAVNSVIQLIQHLVAGMPNAAALAPAAKPDAQATAG